MFDTPRVLSFASTAVLALALSQGVARAQQPAAPAAAPAASPAAAASPTDERRAKWEAMRAEHHANCDKMMNMSPQERQAMRDKMMSMTQEERQAMREEHWKEMRTRAAERGVELPETPPWVAAEQRRKEAQERFETYRKTVEAMTPEQREAAQALFGFGGPQGQAPNWPQPPMPPQQPMPRGGYGYGYGPQGGYPGYGYGPYPGGPGPMPYDEGAIEQAAPPAQPPAN